jgi:hypothetical protein
MPTVIYRTSYSYSEQITLELAVFTRFDLKFLRYHLKATLNKLKNNILMFKVLSRQYACVHGESTTNSNH